MPTKTAEAKRAGLPLWSDYTKAFQKDWVRLTRSGRYDMVRLKSVVMHLIADDAPLPAERRDLALIGEWADHRECHIGGDFLLIYRLDASSVIFVRAGTHAELFE